MVDFKPNDLLFPAAVKASGNFSEQQVRDARQLYKDGQSIDAVARFLGSKYETARRMLLGVTYRDIDGALSPNDIRGGASGSLHHSSVLDEEMVSEIRERLMAGASLRELSLQFGVRMGRISAIACGKAWSSVGGSLELPKNRNRARGDLCGASKLTDIQVSYIKAHLLIGVACSLLGMYFKVSHGAIYQIAKNLTWKHIKPHPNPPRLVPSAETPIRLRGERLNQAFREWNPSKPYLELAEALNRAS